MKNVSLVLGTRPEAIKMAPVYRALKATPGIQVSLISTGQHQELLAQALEAFGMTPDLDLRVMRHGQSLSGLTCSILQGLETAHRQRRPDLVLVHGDTTTCFTTALSCFYQGIPVAHVEAGLRTYRLDSPFPEEFNRQSVARLACCHFAPNEEARQNLITEGVSSSQICVTGGSTTIDAIRQITSSFSIEPLPPRLAGRPSQKLSLITLHRRESDGETLRALLTGIREAAQANSDTLFVYPVHPNPGVKHAAHEILRDVSNVRLTPPLEYRVFIQLLLRSQVVLTDSGGIQEEATYLGKKVLLLRERTERSEGIEEGLVRLAGTHPESVKSAISLALQCGDERSRALPHPSGVSPSRIIADELRRRLS
jgi:UDP-N-acetylglucosamine 2-epimerase (non-hydrolysing)